MNYLAKASHDFICYKIQLKLNSIINKQSENDSESRAQQLNKLNKEASEILIRAEKQYRHLRVGVIAYSSTLSKARLKQKFQRKITHFKSRCLKDFDYIIHIAQYLDISKLLEGLIEL